MTFTTAGAYDQGKADIQSLSVDDQLGLLWFVYTEMGKSITPAAPGASGSDIAQGLFDRVKELPYEEQLQVMRDIASKNNTEISRIYGSMSPETKLAFWYFLSLGMDEGTIIPMPSDYQLPEAGKVLLGKIQSMDFQQQIDFLRGTVLVMGAEAAPGPGI
ncbi:MAG: Orange carotenoid protein [Oscillatoriaceae cyanobacterium Prado104]|nr:Orange carotenoid protein [Oscillatoriaceae cyanobacterium Prado104]